MPKFILALPLSLALLNCTNNTNAVSDYNGDSVKITGHQWEENAKVEAQAEATRICNLGGKGTAEFASVRLLPNYQQEFLFLCL